MSCVVIKTIVDKYLRGRDEMGQALDGPLIIDLRHAATLKEKGAAPGSRAFELTRVNGR